MDPIHATSSFPVVKNQKLGGRILKLSQGQHKKEGPTVVIKKTKLSDIQDEQDQVIYDALTDATSDKEEELDDDDEEPMDLEDLLAAGDSILFLFFDDDDDDDDFEFDGVFEEIYSKHQTREHLTEKEAAMNRQNRREPSKKNKRQKLPHKGFGYIISSEYNDKLVCGYSTNLIEEMHSCMSTHMLHACHMACLLFDTP